ncbi:S8 family serine peptidase [Pseudooceanicola algae]|nr:S8 family serine peptidase [Pseudooceanicola algae]
MIGDLDAIWADYTGNSVLVGIYDDGVAQHEDLITNYNYSARVTLIGSDPLNDDYAHGTAVAGIVAAADNDTGGIGIAFDAQITGVNYLTEAFDLSYANYLSLIEDTARFDVVNFSWASLPYFNDFNNIGDQNSQAYAEVSRMQIALDTGRDGLGTIFVKSAGNYANDPGWLEFGIEGNANAEGLNAAHGIIVTAATDRDGNVESYSNWGQSILVAAPAATVTTDIEGSGGLSTGNYAETFGGTSAAAPVVSGVVALMLEANPDLHWTDVRNILALSASQTGSDFGSEASGYEIDSWFANAAQTWNGGGLTFNESYGYGQVDAFMAVRMAEVWTEMAPDAADRQASYIATADIDDPVTILDDDRTVISMEVRGAKIEIEHLNVTISYKHSWVSDLELSLFTPAGTEIPLLRNEGYGSYNDSWTFGVSSLMGTSADGTWELVIEDSVERDSGVVYDLELEFHGSRQDKNDIYTFTSDFQELLAVEYERGQISDDNDGNDWINVAALTANVSLSLSNYSGEMRVDGTRWVSISGKMENFAGGDGNDIASGNDAANTFIGGRGNDWFVGKAGHDSLVGGEGNDQLEGNEGQDSLSGGHGTDTLRGGEGEDRLRGDGDNDWLYGEEAEDVINGGTWHDRIYGGQGEDSLFGDAGFDRLEGGSGDDHLDGGHQADNLYGGVGNDVLYGNFGLDRLFSGSGDDIAYGGDQQDGMFGDYGNDHLFGGAGGDNFFASYGNDTIEGGSGDDTINAGAGFDRIDGGEGNDILRGNFNADLFSFRSNFGQDTITDFDAFNRWERIDLREVTEIASFDDLVASHLSQIGSDSMITDGQGNSIRLKNVSVADLDEGDFLF